MDAFLMFSSGIIATLFIAYVVVLHDHPLAFSRDWRRALVLPRRIRRRVRLVATVSQFAVWWAAVWPASVLVDNMMTLGDHALGIAPPDRNYGWTVSTQIISIVSLVLYILGHRFVFASTFDAELAMIRRRRKEQLDLETDTRGDSVEEGEPIARPSRTDPSPHTHRAG